MIFRHPQARITAIAGIISALFVAPTFAAPTATATPKPTPRPTPKPTPKPVLKPAVTSTPKPTPKPAAATAAAATRPATNAPSTTPTASAPVTSTPTTSASAAASANEVVATVNNEKILKSDIDRLVAAAQASNKALQGDSEEAKKKLAEARREIITNRIDLILWMQEAARRNIVPAKGDVDKFVAQNKSVFRNNTEWVNFLNGRTEADYRKTIAQEMVITELFARLTAENNVTEEEIRAYYEANKSKFQVPEMVRAHHIFFILPKNADQTEKSRVTAQANEVLKKAQAPGANFEALAREYSQASDVMQDSGGLPLFWRGGTPLPKEFQDAAFGGRTGQIVGPVQTSRGLHIIKIDEKIPSGPAPLSVDIRRDIRLALKTKKNDELLNAFLADLNKKAVITRTG